jgi:hypothetical protein
MPPRRFPAARQDASARLLAATRQLPKERRAVLLLHDLERTHRDIAARGAATGAGLWFANPRGWDGRHDAAPFSTRKGAAVITGPPRRQGETT